MLWQTSWGRSGTRPQRSLRLDCAGGPHIRPRCPGEVGSAAARHIAALVDPLVHPSPLVLLLFAPSLIFRALPLFHPPRLAPLEEDPTPATSAPAPAVSRGVSGGKMGERFHPQVGRSQPERGKVTRWHNRRGDGVRIHKTAGERREDQGTRERILCQVHADAQHPRGVGEEASTGQLHVSRRPWRRRRALMKAHQLPDRFPRLARGSDIPVAVDKEKHMTNPAQELVELVARGPMFSESTPNLVESPDLDRAASVGSATGRKHAATTDMVRRQHRVRKTDSDRIR